jgi:TatD DNase family protein
MREKQEFFYRAQLALARQYDLPVVLHVRRSADRLLKHLRAVGQGGYGWRGIAHAFNGSDAQAAHLVAMGFKLGFGGALTFERALQLRSLAQSLPLSAIVLETDAPDIPPHWLYVRASARAMGVKPTRNSPTELPRIAQVVAELKGVSLEELSEQSCQNVRRVFPRMGLQ